MRVICPECSQKGRITKTNKMSLQVSDLYCQCTDAECGHTWVSRLSYSHTLSPSARTSEQLVLHLARNLSPEGWQQVLHELGAR